MYVPVSGLKRWLTAPQALNSGGSRGSVVIASVVVSTSLGLFEVRLSQVTSSAVVHQLFTTSHHNPSAHVRCMGVPRKHTKNLQIESDFELQNCLYRSWRECDFDSWKATLPLAVEAIRQENWIRHIVFRRANIAITTACISWQHALQLRCAEVQSWRTRSLCIVKKLIKKFQFYGCAHLMDFHGSTGRISGSCTDAETTRQRLGCTPATLIRPQS